MHSHEGSNGSPHENDSSMFFGSGSADEKIKVDEVRSHRLERLTRDLQTGRLDHQLIRYPVTSVTEHHDELLHCLLHHLTESSWVS